MKKCIRCEKQDDNLGFIFHPNHCLSCVIELTTKNISKKDKKKLDTIEKFS